jgi:hypothetical protein
VVTLFIVLAIVAALLVFVPRFWPNALKCVAASLALAELAWLLELHASWLR